jgi:phosphatidate phosphatase PAH1
MKTRAIIIDIDGTLADDRWRRHLLHDPTKTWEEINSVSVNDPPNLWCQNLVEIYYKKGYHVIFLTARNEKAKDLTKAWLHNNVSFADYTLLMRPLADNKTPDWMIKEVIYRNDIEPTYDIELCVDDRQTVADMWRRNGLTCLHCDGESY